MNTKFRCVFNFSKEIKNLRIKNLVVGEYVKLRGEVVDLLNPMYETWNAEFGDFDDINEYNNFIRAKQEEVIKQSGVNDRAILIQIESDEECDLVAVTKKTALCEGGIKIHVTLEPIEE